jgi:hypothetical protein
MFTKRLPSRSSLLLIGMFVVVLILSVIVIKQEQQIRQEAAGQGRTFTFINNTNQTIWVGSQGNPGSIAPNNGGWELPANASGVTVSVPDGWAGRFWGRTGCTTDSQGKLTCETGDCGNGLQCNGAGGIPPATLAEFTLNGANNLDYYNVSLVDGYNVPIVINTVGSAQPDPVSATGCVNRPAANGPSGCTSEINSCPQELQVKNASGKVVACKSACTAFGTEQYCCTGSYDNATACNPKTWPVDYTTTFKNSQPFAITYAHDYDGTIFGCSNCNYKIIFGIPSGAQPSANPSNIAVSPTFNCIGGIPCVPTLAPSSAASVSSMPKSPVLSSGPVTSIQPQPGGPQPGNPDFDKFIKFILCNILLILFRLLGIDLASLGIDVNSICRNT